MADDVTAAPAEQADTQATPADVVQPEAVTTDLTADAPDDGAADVDAAPEGAGDDPADLDSLWTRYPALREQYEAKAQEREIAGANRERARLQREAGKKGQTKQNVQRFLTELGVEAEDTSRLDYFYDLAAANAAYELAQALPDAVLRGFVVPVEAREKALEMREAGDWDGYVGTIVTSAVEAKVAALRAEDEKTITKRTNERLAAEMKARGIEKAPIREGAPPRPSASGTPAGPSPAEYAAATRQQREQWRRDGVSPAIAQ